MKRTTLLLSLGLAATAVLAAGCGASDGPEAIPDPRPSTTTTAPPADPPADGIVWQEVTGGGFVPAEFSAGEVPDVTIYADGRILRSVLDTDGRTGRPVALEQGQIAPDDLAAFLAAVGDSGLFEPGTDFGQPGVTDQPSTTVIFQGDGPPMTVNVYALDFAFDQPVGDVTVAQAQRRDALKAMLARARDLATDTEPYIPEQVRASLVTNALGPEAGVRPQPWPGPPVSAFGEAGGESGLACLVIEGPDAETVTLAAVDNPDGYWTIDGSVHQIVTAPLVPGQEGCPPT